MTWLAVPGGCQIFFNRDERRTRGPEIPPAVRIRGGTRFIAPLDGDFGGTWIAVNEFGLTLCLLNGFPPAGGGARSSRQASRGLLPLSLIELPTRSEALLRLQETDLDRFRPFMLATFAPDGDGLLARWSGRDLALDRDALTRPPLVSSSFYTEELRRDRCMVFSRLARDGRIGNLVERHLAYHRSHEPQRGPSSPCMHRADAETVSFSRVEIGERTLRFHYVPGAPCLGAPGGQALSLERRPAVG